VGQLFYVSSLLGVGWQGLLWDAVELQAWGSMEALRAALYLGPAALGCLRRGYLCKKEGGGREGFGN